MMRRAGFVFIEQSSDSLGQKSPRDGTPRPPLTHNNSGGHISRSAPPYWPLAQAWQVLADGRGHIVDVLLGELGVHWKRHHLPSV